MKSSHFLPILLFLLVSFQLESTTWKEPWQKEIIEKADHFVFAKVISNVDSIGLQIEIIRSFGETVNGRILIDDFFMLDICSSSGGMHDLYPFELDESGYFMLKKGENGNYQLPTPTSGYAKIVDDKVHATYRHSYHMAAVDRELYEWSYQEIWNYAKTGKYDKLKVNEYIDSFLNLPVAGFEEEEIDIFFQQHVALEMAYLLDIKLGLERLKPFTASDNFHAQVSALRAMRLMSGGKVGNHLIEFIFNEDKDRFSKVMAIQALSEAGNRRLKKKVLKRIEELSTEETSFGGSIMDPRVCTSLPNPKQAAAKLLGQ